MDFREIMVLKQRKEHRKKLGRILRMKRMADGILNGDDCRTEWASREGMCIAQINKDFAEIYAVWLKRSKASTRRKATFRIKQLEAIKAEAHKSFELSKRVLFTCGACQGEGYLKNKGACSTCKGEGIIERYDTPGDHKWLSVKIDCVKECGRLEGLHVKIIPPKPPKGPRRPHLHLHANASNLWDHASHEEVIQHRVLMDNLQRRLEDGSNGDGVKVIDVKKEESDE